MPKLSPDNERIKHAYFAYLREAKGRSEHTIDSAAKAIARFEQSTRSRDFKKFHINLAVASKKELAGERSGRTGKALSLSTIRATVFPATKVEVGPEGGFVATGLDRAHWSTAAPVREVFKRAFTAANLPYFTPHRLRDTLVQLGQCLCRSPEEFKAWSQNIGHEGTLVTFTSYGQVATYRQGELIREVGTRASGEAVGPDSDDLAAAAELLARLRKRVA